MPLAPRPWPVSGRIVRTEVTNAYYPYGVSVYWQAIVTMSDGTTRAGATYYGSETGYPRKGGSGKGAAVNDAYRMLGYSKASDRAMRELLKHGPLTLERPEGERAHYRVIPTGRDRMRRLAIRPDVKVRPDMTARERWRVEYRRARLAGSPLMGVTDVAIGRALRAMPRKFHRGYTRSDAPYGAAIGGYVVERYGKRGERPYRWEYLPTCSSIALKYARENGGRVPTEHWSFVESYRRELAHYASWWRRFPDPDRMTAYYGDRIADVQEGRRTVSGEYIYPLRNAGT